MQVTFLVAITWLVASFSLLSRESGSQAIRTVYFKNIIYCTFYFTHEFVLLSFFMESGDPHPLVGLTLRAYLAATSSFRKSEKLFLIPHGFRNGQAASTLTVASHACQDNQKSLLRTSHSEGPFNKDNGNFLGSILSGFS